MLLLASVPKKRMFAAFFAGLLSSEESYLSVAQLAEALARNNEWTESKNNQFHKLFEIVINSDCVVFKIVSLSHSRFFMKSVLWDHGHRVRIHRESDGKGNTSDTLFI
jgi:hypothetical protein